MAKRLGIGVFASFTDLDLLLNTRQYRRAGRALTAIRAALGALYSERMQHAEDSTGVELIDGFDGPTPRDLTPYYGMN